MFGREMGVKCVILRGLDIPVRVLDGIRPEFAGFLKPSHLRFDFVSRLCDGHEWSCSHTNICKNRWMNQCITQDNSRKFRTRTC